MAAGEALASNNILISPLITSEQNETKSSDSSAIVTSVTNTTTIVTATGTVATVARETKRKTTLKDEKEPIQIVRGGRVITLPPIEAPATRSKRLQTKPEPAPKTYEAVKRGDKFR